MNSIEDFILLLRDELGLSLTVQDAEVDFDSLPGWDSVHLVWLLSALEGEVGSNLSLPDLLATSNLRGVYALVTE